MILKFKKLNEKAVLPSRATPGSAGLDLTAISSSYSPDHYYIEYGTGLSVEIPEGYVGLLFPRSSVSKIDLMLANSIGIIDSDYRGEIKLRFKEILPPEIPPGTDKYGVTLHTRKYCTGDRVGQLIIMPVPCVTAIETENVPDTARGNDGFGSTGT